MSPLALLNLGLLAATLAVGGQVWRVAVAPEPEQAALAVTAAASVAAPVAEGWVAPGPGGFDDIARRPLFAASRRPAEAVVVVAPAAPASPPPPLRLTGITHMAGTSRALLRNPKGETLALAVGELVEGWAVARIEPTGIELSRGQDRARIGLGDDPPGARPARPDSAATARTQRRSVVVDEDPVLPAE